MGPIWQAQLGRTWLCSLAPAGNPIYCPIGHQIWGPLGSVRIVQKEVGGRNFSLGGGLRDEVGGRVGWCWGGGLWGWGWGGGGLGGGGLGETRLGVKHFLDMGLKKRWGS